ncbi:RNA replicase beta subunit [Escherichia phage Qbeta]|uniref:RNA-directed RNA polymerase subunit beta n=1 Tax=Qbeta virus (strain MX1) TaxID=2789016 RepID=RDRP_BPMX1|nr:RNA replicase beta subunit [Escherichia phage Qbeta]O64308.1 RecName: Full=RNA-directed RNA polymerase subunit beta; AltName: Full=RNA replicase beta chain [Escherichia phage Qbeta]AAC14701.1 replicase [Escherichia phage Qbeta]
MSKTLQSRKSLSGKLRRAANTRIVVEGNLALSIANDLLSALDVEPFNSEEDCISRSPKFGISPDQFRNSYLRAEIMSKYDSFSLGINTEAVAWEKFLAAEAECAKTNLRLYRPNYNEDFNFSLGETCIHMARRKIVKLLGDSVPFEAVLRHCRFSGGATTTNSRLYGHPSFKFALAQECTPRAVPYVQALKACTNMDLGITKVSPFNKAVTVPKNSKTDRCIAIEPGWNMFFQLGIGGVIREKLHLWNIDLNDQTINQVRAYSGSCSNELATVDLSSASDTISLALVELLLPPAWFKVLTDLRSRRGMLPDGRIITYEKISSMGNGFTFELESLIFAALARSLCELLNLQPSSVTVYGDDIILPSDACSSLIEVFSYVGFRTNEKKTFFDGPFRESCGKHYFMGVDVTPFYIRHRIVSPSDLILVLNQMYRWATIDGVWDPRVYPVYTKYRRLLPDILRRNVVPDGYGDGALVGSVLTSPFAENRGWVRRVPMIIDKKKDRVRDERGSYLYELWSLQQLECDSEFPFNGSLVVGTNDGVCTYRHRERVSTAISDSVGAYDIVWIPCSSRVLAPYGDFRRHEGSILK